MQSSEIISIFANDSVSPLGREGQTYWKKDVYERYLRLSDLANQGPEDTQRSVRVGCIVVFTISHDVG